MSKIIKAIKAINPAANVSVGNDSLDEITWVDGTTPDWVSIGDALSYNYALNDPCLDEL